MAQSNNSNQSLQEDLEDPQESISKKIELNHSNSSNSKLNSIKGNNSIIQLLFPVHQYNFFGGNLKEKLDDDKSLKRSYCKLNQEVLDYLNQFFEEVSLPPPLTQTLFKKNYPSRKEIQTIANKFNFNFVKVDNWFKHKRRQQSKKGLLMQQKRQSFSKHQNFILLNCLAKCFQPTYKQYKKIAFLTQCDIKNVKNWFSYKRKQFYKQYRKNLPDELNLKSDSCSLNSECQENNDDDNFYQNQPNSSEFQRSLSEFIESQIPEKFIEGYKDGTLLMEFLKGKVEEMKLKQESQQPLQNNNNNNNNNNLSININNSSQQQAQFQLNPQQIQLAVQLALLANSQKKQQETPGQQPQQINVSQNTTNLSNNFNIFQFPQSNTLFQSQQSNSATPLPLPFIINQSSDNTQPISKEQNVEIESILSKIFNQNSNNKEQQQQQQLQTNKEDPLNKN